MIARSRARSVGRGWYPGAMPEAPFGARRPHPVADVPPAALADGQAPAKGWLLALVAARPLQDAPALPMPDLARDAPGAVRGVLRAVGSEAELRRLQPGGDLAGAGGARRRAGRRGRAGGAPWPRWRALRARAVGGADAWPWRRSTRRPPPRWPSAWPSCATRSRPRRSTAAPARRGPTTVASFRVHDARGDWEAARRAPGRRRAPFALLAVEADDAPRLVAADADAARRSRASSRPSAASCARRRPGREDDGRCGSSPPSSAPPAPARWPSGSPTPSPPWPRCAARPDRLDRPGGEPGRRRRPRGARRAGRRVALCGAGGGGRVARFCSRCVRRGA